MGKRKDANIKKRKKQGTFLQGGILKPKKNDRDGGEAQLGREVSHEKEGEHGSGQVGKLLVRGP